MHFILHNESLDNTHQHQTLQDCNYAKLVANGQGSFLNSNTFTFAEEIEQKAIPTEIIVADQNIQLNVLIPYFSLRAPPVI